MLVQQKTAFDSGQDNQAIKLTSILWPGFQDGNVISSLSLFSFSAEVLVS